MSLSSSNLVSSLSFIAALRIPHFFLQIPDSVNSHLTQKTTLPPWFMGKFLRYLYTNLHMLRVLSISSSIFLSISEKVFWFVSCLNFSVLLIWIQPYFFKKLFLWFRLISSAFPSRCLENLSCFQITPGSLNSFIVSLVFGHDISYFSYIFDLGLYVQYFLTARSLSHIVFYEASFFF